MIMIIPKINLLLLFEVFLIFLLSEKIHVTIFYSNPSFIYIF